jgi:hypothetical protein
MIRQEVHQVLVGLVDQHWFVDIEMKTLVACTTIRKDGLRQTMDLSVQGLVLRKVKSTPVSCLQEEELKVALFYWHCFNFMTL